MREPSKAEGAWCRCGVASRGGGPCSHRGEEVKRGSEAAAGMGSGLVGRAVSGISLRQAGGSSCSVLSHLGPNLKATDNRRFRQGGDSPGALHVSPASVTIGPGVHPATALTFLPR